MQHLAADRESKRRSLADDGRRMQHRAAVRACQAQRQKSECYRKKRTKSASISHKNRLQHDAAYQKCYQVVRYKKQIKRLQCDAIFKEKKWECGNSTFNTAKWRRQQEIVQSTVDARKTSIDRSTSEKNRDQ